MNPNTKRLLRNPSSEILDLNLIVGENGDILEHKQKCLNFYYMSNYFKIYFSIIALDFLCLLS